MDLQGFTRLCAAASVLAVLVLAHDIYLRSAQVVPGCPAGASCGEQRAALANDPASQRLRWQAMVHPAAAVLLGLAAMGLVAFAWRRRRRPGQQLALPLLALALVLLQGASSIGVAAVPRAPLVVTVHVLLGLSSAALLWWLALRHGGLFTGYARPLLGSRRDTLGPWVLAGVVLVYLQSFLGAWLSSNDAALACADFPLCRGELIPGLDLEGALQLWHSVQGRGERVLLGDDARVTLHWLHRSGALLVLLYLGALALRLLRGAHDARLKTVGGALGLALSAQIGAGIASELLALPVVAAVAHGAGAALLLLTLVSVYHVLRPAPSVI